LTFNFSSLYYVLFPHFQEQVLSVEEKKKLSLQETRRTLPVYAYRDEFIQAVREHQVLIIEGETGSGKTTQLPQYLYEAGFCSDNKRLGCTQPRRVAAMSVASRVAEEMNTKVGALVIVLNFKEEILCPCLKIIFLLPIFRSDTPFVLKIAPRNGPKLNI
jgi:hypothetical protein